jgi:plastocyanin
MIARLWILATVLVATWTVGAAPRGLPVRQATDTTIVDTTIIDTTIVIRTAGSVLEFKPPGISARQGTRVRIRYINDGTLPHNVVVVRDDDDIDDLVTAAYGADRTGYVPVADSAKLLGYTALASPGQTVEVTFVMPPPGVYTYVCLFPGHANSMLGSLRSLR